MGDSIYTEETNRTGSGIEGVVNGFLNDASFPSTYDRTYCVKRGSNKLIVVIEYTA